MSVAARAQRTAPVRRPALIPAVLRPLRGLLPLLVLLGAWQLFGSDDALTFPPPSTWLSALADMNSEGVLWPGIWSTLETFVLAIVVATVLGAVLGMVIGSSRAADRAMTPFLDFCRSVPPPVIVPVATLLVGLSLFTTVTIVVLSVVWPIVLNTAAATRAVPPTRMEAARVLQLSRLDRIFKVMVPSALPGIALGVRVAVSIALIVTLLAEILGAGEGVGRLLYQRQQVFDSASVWGLLLVVGVLGFLLNGVVSWAERRLLRNWISAASG